MGDGILGVGDESEGSVLDARERVERALLGFYGGRRSSIARGICAATAGVCGAGIVDEGLLIAGAGGAGVDAV